MFLNRLKILRLNYPLPEDFILIRMQAFQLQRYPSSTRFAVIGPASNGGGIGGDSDTIRGRLSIAAILKEASKSGKISHENSYSCLDDRPQG